jgi:hypothetical protein
MIIPHPAAILIMGSGAVCDIQHKKGGPKAANFVFHVTGISDPWP